MFDVRRKSNYRKEHKKYSPQTDDIYDFRNPIINIHEKALKKTFRIWNMDRKRWIPRRRLTGIVTQ